MNHRRRLRTPLACVMALCCAATFVSTSAFLGCSQQDSAQHEESSAVQVVVQGLTAADVSVVTVTVTGGPSGAGTTTFGLTKNADGTWSGTLTGLAVGNGYVFTMTASSSGGTALYSGVATAVSIVKDQVSRVVITAQQSNAPTPFTNAPPVIDSVLVSSVKVVPGEAIALAASAHDPNPGDTLTYSWISTAGTFSASSAAATTWTAPAAAGTYPVTLTVSDQTGASVQIQVSIAVNASNGTGSASVTGSVNTWPVVTNVSATPNYLVKGAQTMLTAIASDADGDSLTYAWSSDCAGGLTSATSVTPSFTLDSNATNANCTFTVAVADNRGGSTTGSLTLPVGKPSANLAPTIGKTTQSSAVVGATDSVALSVSASDPQGLALTFSWTATDGVLSTPISTTGSSQVIWTPPATAGNSWTVTATVTDSAGVSALRSFTIKPSSCFGVVPAASSAWSAAVMADTQWIGADDGKNPGSDAIDIVNQLNAQFIAKGVKLVVQVGDLTDNGSTAALDMRAEFAQALYNAGIGYFPLRGNHDSSTALAAEFKRVFPQTQSGMQNATPTNAFIANPDDVNTLPAAVLGLPFSVGANFSQPSSAIAGVAAWDGLSYAFDYNNARFVLLDQFMKSDGTSASGNNYITPQQPWISATLASRAASSHAIVFSHKGLITENHTDALFGSDPSKDPAGQDAFISSLQNNGVRYLMMGHDHMHNRAIVTTTDGATAKVQDIICASNSSKFYIPLNPSNDVAKNVPAFGHPRETPIMQELNTVGYYIITFDGIKATVDFYSAVANPTLSSGEYLLSTTPQLNFTKRESFGYGLNGKQFVVAQGASYSAVEDGYGATTARILGGTNANTNIEGGGRNPVKTVDTGWTAGTCATSSDILSLWITASTLGSDQTDTYALSISYDPANVTADKLASGTFGLAVKDAKGNWVNAVDRDFGGGRTFVKRAWQQGDVLGTYGVDPATNTAWAVVNYSGDFAVASFNN
jgi:hypothetical protein